MTKNNSLSALCIGLLSVSALPARAETVRPTTPSLGVLRHPDLAPALEFTLYPLRLGDRSPAVASLFQYLKRYGYFPNPALQQHHPQWAPVITETPEDPQLFGPLLKKALVAFQRNHGLTADGTFNPETAELMQRERCGLPDGNPYTPPLFKAHGSKWATPNVSYSFSFATTPDLTSAQIKPAIKEAFAKWSAVTALTFTEVTYPQSTGQILIEFFSGNHNDIAPFDGPGGEAAHAFYPYENDYPLDGDIHFDDAETWSVDYTNYRLGSIALHEIGHAIGLDHSTDELAVMYPYFYSSYPPYWQDLTEDDITGIQSIYGPPSEIAWSPSGPISGMYCKQITEPLDPQGWSNNYLCLSSFTNVTWSHNGHPGSGRCTQITEPVEPSTTGWDNNYLCTSNSPYSNLYFYWSHAGPMVDKKCVMLYEFSDVDTWNDNFLCYTGNPNPY